MARSALLPVLRLLAGSAMTHVTYKVVRHDENGNWRRELARGRDRPDTEVEDSN